MSLLNLEYLENGCNGENDLNNWHFLGCSFFIKNCFPFVAKCKVSTILSPKFLIFPVFYFNSELVYHFLICLTLYDIMQGQCWLYGSKCPSSYYSQFRWVDLFFTKMTWGLILISIYYWNIDALSKRYIGILRWNKFLCMWIFLWRWLIYGISNEDQLFCVQRVQPGPGV